MDLHHLTSPPRSWRRWLCLRPLYLALGVLGLTVADLVVGQAVIGLLGQTWLADIVVGVLIAITVSSPPLSLMILAMHYEDSSSALSKIIALYIALIVICATINLDLMIHFGSPEALPFRGITPVWTTLGPSQISLDWSGLCLAIVDCLHFSVETLSTVGYGDITPVTWYAKLAVDVQILMGLGITVLTVGRHFASASKKGQ